MRALARSSRRHANTPGGLAERRVCLQPGLAAPTPPPSPPAGRSSHCSMTSRWPTSSTTKALRSTSVSSLMWSPAWLGLDHDRVLMEVCLPLIPRLLHLASGHFLARRQVTAYCPGTSTPPAGRSLARPRPCSTRTMRPRPAPGVDGLISTLERLAWRNDGQDFEGFCSHPPHMLTRVHGARDFAAAFPCTAICSATSPPARFPKVSCMTPGVPAQPGQRGFRQLLLPHPGHQLRHRQALRPEAPLP